MERGKLKIEGGGDAMIENLPRSTKDERLTRLLDAAADSIVIQMVLGEARITRAGRGDWR
jgi:hypothetical protein